MYRMQQAKSIEYSTSQLFPIISSSYTYDHFICFGVLSG